MMQIIITIIMETRVLDINYSINNKCVKGMSLDSSLFLYPLHSRLKNTFCKFVGP